MYTAHETFLPLTQKLILFNIFTGNSTDCHQNLALKQDFGSLIFKDDRKLSTAMTVADNWSCVRQGTKKLFPLQNKCLTCGGDCVEMQRNGSTTKINCSY
jgi:hypothetical protein